ncbi:MAG: bifunctional oligoribonuclease/PAP phosphatase NrnA [Lachnospiraceae bacterium]|nr:bifunctional oligoribonuclease/PAP phosphatase NrnA [Lachnospiraceae bacterium]
MDLLKELEGCRTILITGHIRPDGDCIGSVMGTYLYLKNALKDAVIVPMIEKPASEFDFITDIADIRGDFQTDISRFDAFIGLDSSSSDRYGDALRFFDDAGKRIIIDHHISNDGFGDVSVVDPKASSTCELLFGLFEERFIDINVAEALYVGVIHDTGVLRYSNVTPETLVVTSKLISYGFDYPRIIDETFYEKTRIQNEMLGRALVESILFMDGKCIVSKIDRETMEFYGATPHDLEGIVNQLKYTKGVEVAIFMYELDDQSYKVSLRSGGNVDVAKIAKFYNGGGHVRAAGFTMSGSFHDVVNNLSDSIAMQLEGA